MRRLRKFRGFFFKGLVSIFLLLSSMQVNAVNWSISSYGPPQVSYKYTGQLSIRGNFSKAQGGRTVQILLAKGPGPGVVIPITSWSRTSITVNITSPLIHENYWFNIYDSNSKHIVSSSIPLKVSRPAQVAEPGGNNQKKIKPGLATSRLGAKVGSVNKAQQLTVKTKTLRLGVTSCADGYTASPPDTLGRYRCLSKKLYCQTGYKPQPAAQYDAIGGGLYYVCAPE